MIQTAETLDQYLLDARRRLEEALADYLQFDENCPKRLAEAMRYSLLAPAKRLRPILVLMAAEACGSPAATAMPAACAIEMIHTYSLIHDDLPAMDDDDLRRGRPSCHKAFDEALAILAGDALLAQAFEIVAREVQPPEVGARCVAVLAEAAGPTQLVAGQVEDLTDHDEEGSLELLESIHARKTGAMLCVSLRLGALCAGSTPAEEAALVEYGRRLGMAFQITDDLLDVRGDEQAMGKRVGKDAAHGKLTFPGLLGVEASARRAEALVAKACDGLKSFSSAGDRLRALARYVLERDH